MIFLGNFNKATDTRWVIGFQHNMPFDADNGIKNTNGVNLTEAELNEIGILVDVVPEPLIPAGQMVGTMYINPQNKEIMYEYVDIPQTPEQKITELQSQNAQMLLALIQGGMI